MKNKLKTTKQIVKKISELMLDKKAFDIKIINVNKLTTLTDVFIVCSSSSGPQTKAISGHIKDELTKYGIKPGHVEGYENLKWILMDYINIIVHIFDKESRNYYNFERLWADGDITTIN